MMTYYLQFMVIVLSIIVEHFHTKWAKAKIANNEPYKYGFLREFYLKEAKPYLCIN